jgi:hypothetical protein
VRQANYAILILPPNRVNAMSSKFFELLALRKPVLYFGGKGAVSEFLTAHKLGFHITVENLGEQIPVIIANLTSAVCPDPAYDTTAHTFGYHTQLLIKTLQQL